MPKLDFKIPIALTSNSIFISKEKLVSGNWDLSIDWRFEGKNYLNKQAIYF